MKEKKRALVKKFWAWFTRKAPKVATVNKKVDAFMGGGGC